MAKEPDTSEDIALRTFQYTKDQIGDVVGQTEQYVRENPGQALLYAFVGGFVFHHLPVTRTMNGVLKLFLIAIKPAVLIYGASKLYQAVQDEE